MSEPRVSPPYAADERTTLEAFLDYYRATILRQAEDLHSDQLNTPLSPATMTLGGMLKHLAYVEDWWFGVNLAGNPPTAPFDDQAIWDTDEDWDWHSAAHDEPDQLRTLLRAKIDDSRSIMSGITSLDAVTVRKHPRTGEGLSARWVLVHMIEEYARHAGHADLIRESIDGSVDL